MRARGGLLTLTLLAAGTMTSFCAIIEPARGEMPDNPLRATTSQAPATNEAPLEPAPKRPSSGSAVRQFTPYDIWGDEAAAGISAAANPLRQAQATEELPAPTPQQAMSEEEWATIGPHEEYPPGTWHGGARLFSQPWFVHADPNDPQRHIGLGEPLVGTSWRNRPWYVGAFIGGIFNGDLIEGRVQQNNASLLGLRVGHDFDHYWGLEFRFAYSNPNLTDGNDRPLSDSRNYLTDVELLYYPWGDSRWRPYLTAGLGVATFRFNDDQGQAVHDSLLSIPLGFGLKYYCSPQFTLRLDAVENFAVGSHTLDNQYNFSLMGGFEYRFGGKRPSYFPWHGDTVGW